MYPSEKDKQYFFELLSKYNEGTATASETEFVERFMAILEHRRSAAITGFEEEKTVIEQEIGDRLLTNIRSGAQGAEARPAVHRVHFLRRARWWAAAAVVIGLLATSAYYLFNKPAKSQSPDGTTASVDVLPGKEGAMLTLSDGRQVLLDSLGNGLIAVQGTAEVKLQDGQLVYNKNGNAGEAAIAFNTMSTPRGRQFQLLLPDGTKVWLNAASSLTYPTAFTGHERKVEITGEAYFEVAKNARMPFKVKINDHTEVEVLGTHFNVNAYGDEEAIKTTLLEGKVKVIATQSGIPNPKFEILHPGQQATISTKSNQSTQIRVQTADVNEAVAWKNGAFSFTNADLPAVMRQLARWYNIEVEYKGDIPSGTFSGEIGRSLTLDQVLKGLTRTRINYRIEKENKLLILP